MDNDIWGLDTGMGNCICLLINMSLPSLLVLFCVCQVGMLNVQYVTVRTTGESGGGGLISGVSRQFPFWHGVKISSGADTASCLVDTERRLPRNKAVAT